jgi:hypothetical protein
MHAYLFSFVQRLGISGGGESAASEADRWMPLLGGSYVG